MLALKDRIIREFGYRVRPGDQSNVTAELSGGLTVVIKGKVRGREEAGSTVAARGGNNSTRLIGVGFRSHSTIRVHTPLIFVSKSFATRT